MQNQIKERMVLVSRYYYVSALFYTIGNAEEPYNMDFFYHCYNAAKNYIQTIIT